MKTDYNFSGKIYYATDYGFVAKYATPKDTEYILQNAIANKDFKGNSKKEYICNIPFAFDIETTSFENVSREKRAMMYIWQLGINGYIILGRTWCEFKDTINTISNTLQLNAQKRVIIYVHNLAFEFQFIRKLFTWENVFSIEERRPLYARTCNGVEFRCNYLLSGYKLETVAKNLTKYKITKLVGNLDYELIRHNQTPLTDSEIEYCVNDVKIVMLYIKEYLERVRNIHSIPLTKTGAVRKFCRVECFTRNNKDGKKVTNLNYKNKIQSLQINGLNEFNALQRAFCGGFTHANANYVGKTIKDVTSFDFTSSYPSVMVAEKFPMTRGIRINVENDKQFKTLINKYCCIIDIEFTDIYTLVTFENYISASKCFVKENAVENNGRLVCAKRIALTITEIDLMIIQRLYKYSSYRVGYMYIYDKQYLPTEFVKSILQLYQKKTELKGVDGMETEYLNSKEMLNSCYGMCVTSPLRDKIEYIENNWNTTELNENEKEKNLNDYNFSKTRFLYYIWGVYVTAYSRRNLFTAIFHLQNDYIYSDTDSVKFVCYEKHKEYFNQYNEMLTNKLKQACIYHNIDFNLCTPKTIKGKTKLLGAWDLDGIYTRFKTLGAKRYLTETTDGKIHLTVAGLNKDKAVKYMIDTFGKEVFEHFDNYLYIPPQYSGKNLLTYIDFETNGEITDYQGNTAQYNELSSVNLSQSDYTLNLSIQYLQYLLGLREFKR